MNENKVNYSGKRENFTSIFYLAPVLAALIIISFFFRTVFVSVTLMTLTLVFVPLSYVGSIWFKGDLKKLSELFADILVCVSLPQVIFESLEMGICTNGWKTFIFFVPPVIISGLYFVKLYVNEISENKIKSLSLKLAEDKILLMLKESEAWTMRIDYADFLDTKQCSERDFLLLDKALQNLEDKNKIRIIKNSTKYSEFKNKKGHKKNSIHSISLNKAVWIESVNID